MKWGVRRYQNSDGSLTPKGLKRYQNDDGTLTKKAKKRIDKFVNKKNANKNAANRLSVIKEKDKEADKEFGKEYDRILAEAAKKKKVYNKYFNKKGEFTWDGGEAIEIMGDKTFNDTLNKTYDKYKKKYREQYLEATLKDAGLEVTDAGKAYVDELLKKDKQTGINKRIT